MKPAGRGTLVLGTAAAALMAASTWLAGPQVIAAGTSWSPAAWSTTEYRWGLLGWTVGVLALLVAWWRARSVTRLPWMVVASVCWTTPFLTAPIMASRDAFAYANQGQLVLAGFDPYLVGPQAAATPWLSWMDPYWQAEPTPYGPLFLLIASAIAALAGGELVLALLLFRLVAVLGVLLCGFFAVRIAQRLKRSAATAWWLIVLGPLTLIHVAGGAHNDAVMLAGMLAAVYLAMLARPGWAGVVIGAAVAVKATAIVVAPFLLLLAIPGFTWHRLWPVLARAVAGFTTAFGGITLASGLGLGWIAALGVAGKSESWLSLPTGLGIVTGKLAQRLGLADLATGSTDWWRSAGLVVAALVVVTWWWRVRGSGQVRQVTAAGWSLAAVVLLGPVVLPWYCLAPLTLLSVAGDRRTVTWIAGISSLFSLMVLADGHNVFAAQLFHVGLVADVVVAGGLGWLAWRWWRSREPVDLDPVGGRSAPR